jgi:hypothetical protein
MNFDRPRTLAEPRDIPVDRRLAAEVRGLVGGVAAALGGGRVLHLQHDRRALVPQLLLRELPVPLQIL